MTSPTPPAGGRAQGQRGRSGGFLGMPIWAWGLIGVAAAGTIVYLRLHNAGTSSTSDTTGTTAASTDDSQSEYEQISAELVGIEGTDKALLEAIKDLQGKRTKKDHKGGKHDKPPTDKRHKRYHRPHRKTSEGAAPAQDPGGDSRSQRQQQRAAGGRRPGDRRPVTRGGTGVRRGLPARRGTPARRAA